MAIYQFRPHITIREVVGNTGGARYLFGDAKYANSIAKTASTEQLVLLLSQTVDEEFVKEAITTANSSVEQTDVEAAIQTLLDAGVIERQDVSTGGHSTRYDRQLLFFSLFGEGPTPDAHASGAQSRLRDSRVLILGSGGMGSMTALNLARAGIGALHIADFDDVEATNMNRSFLFLERDIGRSKVDVLSERLPEQNPEVDMTFQSLQVRSTEDILPLLQDVDFAVLAADQPYMHINRWFNSACLAADTPYSLAGCLEVMGSVGPMTIPGKTSCLECQGFNLTDIYQGPEHIIAVNGRRTAPSYGPYISALGALSADEVVRYLSKYNSPRTFDTQIQIDFDELTMRHVSRARDPNCPACGDEIRKHS